MSFLKDKIEIGIEEAELKTQATFSGFSKKVKWYLVIVVLLIIPAYFISKSLSKKITLSSYQKTAILAKPSFTNPLPLKISDVSLTRQGAGAYTATVQISNQNLDLSFENTTYQFNFYNAEQQVVHTFSDKLFLLPDQTKYIIAPRFASSDAIVYADFKLPDSLVWQKRLSIPKVQLITSAPGTYQQDSPQAFVAEGNFLNNSPYTLKRVRLTFVLFDFQNKIMGSSSREENNIASFGRRAYKQLWPGVFAGDVSRVEVSADTNTMDPNNLSTGATGGAGDLGRPSGTRQ